MVERIKSYVINLAHKTERYENVLKQLKKINIEPERFNAVYTKELSPEYISSIVHPSVDYSVKYGAIIDCQFSGYGAIGCTLSHVELWKKLVESKEHDKFLIFEDDVEITNNKDEIDKYIEEINKIDYDVAYIGYIRTIGMVHMGEKVNDKIIKSKKIIYGTHAYIVTKEGAEKLLKNVFPIVTQVDTYMSHMIQRGLKVYRPHQSYINQNMMEMMTSDLQNVNLKSLFNRYSVFFIIFSLTLIILFYYLFRRCNTSCKAR